MNSSLYYDIVFEMINTKQLCTLVQQTEETIY